MRNKKRIIALLAAIMMVVQMMPMNMLAEALEGYRMTRSNTLEGAAYYQVDFVMDDE